MCLAGSVNKDLLDNNTLVQQETENISVVRSINGEGSNTLVEQHNKQQEPTEIIDIESVQCTILDDGPKPWLSFSHITLTITDQDLIIQGKRLNDKHLNFAQAILKKQCAHLNGLYSTLLLFRMKEVFSNCKDVIQMIHTRENHWIVASTVGCCAQEVRIYDSLFTSVDCNTSLLLKQIFGQRIKIVVGTSPRQEGVHDCGVHAIAVSTALACGVLPESIKFDQPLMRHHLIKCFEQTELIQFPLLP